MDKRKKLITKIRDGAAAIVTWYDSTMEKVDRRMVIVRDRAVRRMRAYAKRVNTKVTGGAAAIVTWYDLTMEKYDRFMLMVRYRIARRIHESRGQLLEKKKWILGHFAGAILVAIALVAVFSSATGFQYAYNGKVLGYVKNQEDVTKVLDLVSAELTKEYDANIDINAESDITFETVSILDKEVDDIDTVLKRLTYLSDMEAESFGIYVDGKLLTTCATETDAKAVLEQVQREYLATSESTVYEDIGFKEKVEIMPLATKLIYIDSVEEATEKILTGGSKEVVYEVKEGDTFFEITQKYDTTFEELKKINPDIKEDSIYPGDKIVMNKAVSAVTVVTVETSTYAETVEYKTVYKKSSSMYEGDYTVEQEGENGKRVVTARITRENGESVNKQILESETIREPVKRIVIKGTKEVPKTHPTGTLIMPVSGYTLTSEFGWRWGRNHDGLDLAAPEGTTIRAADGGTVTRAGWYSGYGLCIDIDHGGGKVTRYGHCSAVNVSAGEQVYQGQVIGAVGNTGNSYGAHCHFEVRIGGTAVNPYDYM